MRVTNKLIKGVALFSVVFSFLLSVSTVSAAQFTITNRETNTSATVNTMPNTNTNTGTPVTNVTSTTTQVTGVVSNTCTNLVNSFQKYGDEGTEVVKLQNFLNQYMGANLNGLGFYGPVTMQEVRNLQYTYGLNVTGIQHEKTTALINSIVCGNIAVRTPVFAPKTVWSNYSYMGGVSTVAPTNIVYTNSSTNTTKNIYPNPIDNGNTVVRNTNSTTTGKNIMIDNSATGTDIMATTSSSSFWNNLKADFAKIKENYKAYLLVFVLVLALFWFLRKAATE